MRMEAPVVERWAEEFEGLLARVGPCFGRRDLRSRAGGYVRGLLGRVERKNAWQLSEHLGHAKPYAVQRLLGSVEQGGLTGREAQRRGLLHELVRAPESERAARGNRRPRPEHSLQAIDHRRIDSR